MSSSQSVFETPELLAKAAADRIADNARKAISERDVFTLVLSGGSTPAVTYRHLSTADLDWSKIHLFWGDERPVISTHPDSNYFMAHENLIKNIKIPGGNVHRIASEEDTMLAAQQYQDEILDFFGITEGSFPSFDMILLGLGDDGHTASLFPETEALNDTQNLVVENYVKKLNTRRITFTLPLINAAKNILFLVAGEAKKDMVARIIKNADPSSPVPARLISPAQGHVDWFLDKKAAEKIV